MENYQTNMSKELNININMITSCQLMQLRNDQYMSYNLDKESIEDAINSMNSCKYLRTNYVYNTKNRIVLKLTDGNEITLALSDDNKYIGKPTRASGMGVWFYLLNEEGEIYNPFIKFTIV